jgi:phospho-2-dehydro-3-deoxyheptonate aldolase
MGMTVNSELPLPADLKKEYPLTDEIRDVKKKRDREIRDVFTGASDKFLVIVGPCSADNEDAVCEYVHRLARVNEKVSERLVIIPRIRISRGLQARVIRGCSTSRSLTGRRIFRPELSLSVRCISGLWKKHS